MSTGTLITQDQLKQVIELDKTIKETNSAVIAAEKEGSEMLKTLALANGMDAIRKGLTPLMQPIMQLMGTPMGFRTDKDRPRYDKESKKWDNSTYSVEEVRDVLIVGLLRGFRVVGNEINIIAGNFYATKEGMKRFVISFPGLTNFKIQFGVPQMSGEKGALVPALVTWKLNGEDQELDCRQTKRGDMTDDMRIPIRVNSSMGTDAIIGKAESKIYRRVYNILTGANVDTVEEPEPADDGKTIDSTATVANSQQAEDEPADRDEQAQEHDLEEINKQYLTLLGATEDIKAANQIYDLYFNNDSYKWSPKQKTDGLRALEKHHDKIRAKRGARSNGPQQQELSGTAG